mmetsp:Transcript_10697/g.24593  ORF Transcript_10697/g.24593 Transcript_10697/m.24593 type:complete len:140 (-) Transcript_10697:112-531(-)
MALSVPPTERGDSLQTQRAESECTQAQSLLTISTEQVTPSICGVIEDPFNIGLAEFRGKARAWLLDGLNGEDEAAILKQAEFGIGWCADGSSAPAVVKNTSCASLPSTVDANGSSTLGPTSERPSEWNGGIYSASSNLA